LSKRINFTAKKPGSKAKRKKLYRKLLKEALSAHKSFESELKKAKSAQFPPFEGQGATPRMVEKGAGKKVFPLFRPVGASTAANAALTCNLQPATCNVL
ncbi:MAG: hypothetical protein GY765_36125, partial [bacterium]|nr:hypothetical protein [bacterium]